MIDEPDIPDLELGDLYASEIIEIDEADSQLPYLKFDTFGKLAKNPQNYILRLYIPF